MTFGKKTLPPSLAALSFAALSFVFASAVISTPASAEAGYVPEILAGNSDSELRDAVARYGQDRWTLYRRFDGTSSTEARQVMRRFHEEWAAALDALDFDASALKDVSTGRC